MFKGPIALKRAVKVDTRRPCCVWVRFRTRRALSSRDATEAKPYTISPMIRVSDLGESQHVPVVVFSGKGERCSTSFLPQRFASSTIAKVQIYVLQYLIYSTTSRNNEFDQVKQPSLCMTAFFNPTHQPIEYDTQVQSQFSTPTICL